uniref:DDB1- and CUL4-associated factor 13 (inferred by orthology to a human protein) n=1 Tax=Strongyloides venezuelensis TaxID=75913 RepID=A0A0K0G1P7_STRVS
MAPRIKIISRNPDDYQRESTSNIFKVTRNFNAAKDTFQSAIEYTRALNATKLDRVFAKPFVGALEGHNEAVTCITKHPNYLGYVVSGARDGEFKLWHVSTLKCLATIQAHEGLLTGISIDGKEGKSIVTTGYDKQLKVWDWPNVQKYTFNQLKDTEPLVSVALDYVPQGVSHIYDSTDFVVCGEGISLWKQERDTPYHKYDLGVNSVFHVKCNPVEPTIFAGTTSDRSVFILDSRQQVPVTKFVMKLRNNSIAWNPMEAFTFTTANEDYNLYTFDIRHFNRALNVHTDHTAAVMSVDYAPTGKEFVSGSYDRTVRIFNVESSRSREIYHGQRMQQVYSVCYTMDSKYILSGSNEMNIRVWKSNASEQMGPLSKREKHTHNYNKALINQYKSHPEVRKIATHRHVPKSVYSARKEHKIIRESQKRKADNRRANTRKGDEPEAYVDVREDNIISNDLD